MAARSQKTLERAPIEHDKDEEAALDRAADALRKFMDGGGYTPRSLAAVAISQWIIARTRLCAVERLGPAPLMFDLKDMRLRGYVEAALPSIGATLAHLPSDVPFFDLSKDQAVDLFVTGIQAAHEVSVALKEAVFTPDLNDAIPFGDK